MFSSRWLIMPVALLAALFLAVGCEGTRSISNSGYPGSHAPGRAVYPDAAYRGELNEFDLLVPATSEEIDERDIAAALADRRPVTAEPGKSLMVVQSGAVAPDAPMIVALQKAFQPVPFSGIPSTDGKSYAKRLRLAAAEGGCSRILVYWGMLEAQTRQQATATISWIPVIGRMVPDQTQEMRIRLKAAIIDTASGRWRMLTPEPIADDSWSAPMGRAGANQDQVAHLKETGYQALAQLVADQAMLLAER